MNELGLESTFKVARNSEVGDCKKKDAIGQGPLLKYKLKPSTNRRYKLFTKNSMQTQVIATMRRPGVFALSLCCISNSRMTVLRQICMVFLWVKLIIHGITYSDSQG